MNAKLPDGYRDRLCGLLQEEWQGGESYTKFAARLDLGSGKTVKAWLTLDFRAEPDSQKLRKLATHLGWEYWELTRYLDTGDRPGSPIFRDGDNTFDSENNNPLLIAVSSLKQMSDLAVQTIGLLEKLPSLQPDSDLNHQKLPATKPPELRNLPQAIAHCLERSRQTPSQIKDRIRDIRYYGSSEVKLTLEQFEAIQQGKVLPTNEVTMEAIADVVDRDREVFTIQDWLSAWIVSIYSMSAKVDPERPESPSGVDVAS
ncbi:MAG: hypothetical protein J7647_24785 [Cyanobacteria bacterium SBLK]|nr:hypothetical protein [Cyanobacteria bacterium SBLK]